MSWKPEVQIAGEGEAWHDNEFRFATKAEAETSARDLANRWLLVTNHRATESRDPVGYMIRDGKLVPVRAVEMLDLEAGDLVVLDTGFSCHPGGVVSISKDGGGLFFICDVGRHHLSGQVDDDGRLIGIYKAVEDATVPKEAETKLTRADREEC